MRSRRGGAVAFAAAAVAVLAGCAPTPPFPTYEIVRPCEEEIGGQIGFVYKSRGRFLVGRAACDQYFEDITAALQTGRIPGTPLSPMEAMQLERMPAPAPGPARPLRPPPAIPGPEIGLRRPPLTGFQPMALFRPIHFEFDKAQIRPEDAAALHDYAEWLRANPGSIVLIEGHCDERGTTAYNLALGERRAASTKDYLVRRGVEADRILTVSYGEARPTCLESTEACWALNRRAEFLLKER